MSRKTSTKADSTFTRLLGWTVVLALVFSAGMITGQRLIRHDSMPPLVSLSVSKEAQAAAATASKKHVPLKTTFSFYDHLSDAPSRDELVAKDEIRAPAATSKEKVEAPAEKPEPAVEDVQEQAAEQKPVEKEAEPAEAEPAEASQESETADVQAANPNPPVDKVEEEADEEPASALIDRVTKALGAEAEETGESDVAGQFTIQVGNHVSKASAVRELARLRAMSLDAHMVAVEVSGKRFYRVRVGKFASDSDAEVQLKSLGAKDINGMVVPL